MITHSSILASVPWTEEPGRALHGVPRVGHDLVTKSPPLPPTSTYSIKIILQVRKVETQRSILS